MQIISYDFGISWTSPTIINKLGIYDGFQPGPGNAAIVFKNKNTITYIFAAHFLTAYRKGGGVILYKSTNLGKSYKLITFFKKMDEPSITYLGSGNIYLNMRTNYGYRGTSLSTDYGNTWSLNKLDYSLIDPICEGGLLFSKNMLLFTNPKMNYSRSNLTLSYKSSNDSNWNYLQIADPSVLTDYSVIGNGINNNILIVWGSCKIPISFRPWCLWGWEIKITYVPYNYITSFDK